MNTPTRLDNGVFIKSVDGSYLLTIAYGDHPIYLTKQTVIDIVEFVTGNYKPKEEG